MTMRTPTRLFLAVLLSSCANRPDLAEQLGQHAARGTIIVAHRGDSGEAPENTIPAFKSALGRGATLVELDFYTTKDEVLVCFHDRTLDRTTDVVSLWKKKKARIIDYTLAELASLDAGAWKDARFKGTRIPTLESALRTIQEGSATMIEHKEGKPTALVALLRRLDLVSDVLVQSFDWKFLDEVHRLEPRLALAALGGSKSKPHPEGKVLQEIQRTGAGMVHWSFRRIRPEDVASLHAAGLLVCVYTINTDADYDRAIDMGVDAITTDFPGRLRARLSARAEKRPSATKGAGL
jgi:glycerophosphoryl diester phosphodiesterase